MRVYVISFGLGYCNSLFSCLNKSSQHCLQTVQNAAAKLLSQSNRWSHITPVSISLHFPSNFRIRFKILVFTFKVLYGQSPQYISDLLSSNLDLLIVSDDDVHFSISLISGVAIDIVGILLWYFKNTT